MKKAFAALAAPAGEHSFKTAARTVTTVVA